MREVLTRAARPTPRATPVVVKTDGGRHGFGDRPSKLCNRLISFNGMTLASLAWGPALPSNRTRTPRYIVFARTVIECFWSAQAFLWERPRMLARQYSKDLVETPK